MADYIDIKTPKISSITFTPSPVAANASVTVAATVTEEVLRRMYPQPWQSGEFQAGEK